MLGLNVHASYSDVIIHTRWCSWKTKILSMHALVMTSVGSIIHYLRLTKSSRTILCLYKLTQKNPITITSPTSYSHSSPIHFTPKSTTTTNTSLYPINCHIRAKNHASYDNNICDNYGESYIPRYNYDSKQFFLLVDKEDEDEDLTKAEPTTPASPQIKLPFYMTIFSLKSHHIFYLTCHVKGLLFRILVDNGWTHNSLNTKASYWHQYVPHQALSMTYHTSHLKDYLQYYYCSGGTIAR